MHLFNGNQVNGGGLEKGINFFACGQQTFLKGKYSACAGSERIDSEKCDNE